MHDVARSPTRALAAWLATALGYLALTVAMTWPLTTLPEVGVGSYGGDALLNAWALAWNNHVQLGQAGANYFDANVFHPAREALAGSEHLFSVSLVTLPIFAVSRNALLAYDVAWLASFVACALAAHALAAHLVDTRAARVIGGALFAFAFFRVAHAVHLQLLWGCGLPLSLLWLHTWWHAPARGRLAAWATSVVLQVLASWYLAIMVLVANGVALAVLVVAGARQRPHALPTPPLDRPRLLGLIAAAVVGGVVVAPFAWPYLGHAPSETPELAANAASLPGYVMPPRGTLAAAVLDARGLPPRPWTFEDSNYLGVVALALAGCGAVTAGRGGRARCRTLVLSLALVAAVALLLSFGPREAWPVDVPATPFDLLSALPGVGGFRVPARFALLVGLGVAMFAALGADALARRGRSLPWVLLLLALVELRPLAYEIGRPRRLPTPAAHARLASYPPGAVLALPAFSTPPLNWFEAEYMVFATLHWYPLVNGYSRFTPPGYLERMQRLSAFPGSTAVEELRALGVRYVITHVNRYGVDQRAMIAEALKTPGLELLARTDGEYLWRVR